MTMNSGPTFCGDNTGDMSSDQNAAQLGVGGLETATTSADQSGASTENARQQVGDAAQEVKGMASQASASVSDATRRTATQAKDAAGRVVEQAKGQAKQLTQQLKQQVSDQGANMFDEQKTRAADSLGGIVSGLRCAEGALNEEQDKNLASYAGSLADGVESCATYLRDVDARGLMNDAGRFTRRRPELVLGGAFVAGIALIRFLKASRSDTADAQHDGMSASSRLDYATSDQFASSDESASRYRVGSHPGISGAAGDTGPDVAITPAVGAIAADEDTDVSRNPDAMSESPETRTNPATGLTL